MHSQCVVREGVHPIEMKILVLTVLVVALLGSPVKGFRALGNRPAPRVGGVAIRKFGSIAVRSESRWVLDAAVDANEEKQGEDGGFDLQAWFNPNTRGGVIVWCFLLVSLPVGVYNYLVSTGMDPSRVGSYVGAIFVLLSNLLWASTYIFRVANKDMTYAKQLRDYENAVLQKRLEELADDEIDALMQEIEVGEDEKSA